MTDNIDAAITDLTAKLQQQMNEVSETKKAINVLLRLTGKDPMFPDEAPEQVRAFNIEPDQFYGRPLATCAAEFLEQRKKATGKGAMDVADILKALEQGGFDFDAVGWRRNDRLRSLAISLAKNTKVFHRLPNQMFGLLNWYPDVAAKQGRREPAVYTPEILEEEKEEEGGNANAA
ncbi:MAG TPA: hypothetical protein VGR55_15625 [Candidatus Acidoferrum sp.]|nr:hypothetical protein [Candidatus Acidoferrum sp.]